MLINMKEGRLFIVSTPIGNMEDITLRAIRVLKEVSLIAAEDTRRTKKLLNHFNIKTPLTSCFEHNESAKAPFMIERIKNGDDIALVSDAGTPGISDPGYRLIALALENSFNVIPVPGPSAALSSLSISGMPTDRFAFLGFVPSKKKERLIFLKSIHKEDKTVILYESPRRLTTTLKDVLDTIGDADIVVARELTKLHEEVIRGKVSSVLKSLQDRSLKGEITIVLGPVKVKKTNVSLLGAIRDYHKNLGFSLKEAVKIVAEEQDIPKREVYKEAVKLKEKTG